MAAAIALVCLAAFAIVATTAMITVSIYQSRKRLAREREARITASERHRLKWIETGDPAELEAMTRELNEEE